MTERTRKSRIMWLIIGEVGLFFCDRIEMLFYRKRLKPHRLRKAIVWFADASAFGKGLKP